MVCMHRPIVAYLKEPVGPGNEAVHSAVCTLRSNGVHSVLNKAFSCYGTHLCLYGVHET